jgi:predicted alpha/beta superfamily hydrolase
VTPANTDAWLPDGWRTYDDVHGRKNTVTGTVIVWPTLASKELDRSAKITVYLPPSLAKALKSDAKPARRYPVFYFHDGQNVFDDHTSHAGEWRADETLQALARDGIEAMAVGIPNGEIARFDEYNPYRTRTPYTGRRIVGGKATEYLDWVVEGVKPLIDGTFPTDRSREATGTIGSSLGGLISLYAMVRHPDVFGMIGAMSNAIRWQRYAILKEIRALDGERPRVHVDMGGREWKGGLEDARKLRDTLIEKGWREDVDLNYVEERYAIHREDAWARRLPDALRFLLKETEVAAS